MSPRVRSALRSGSGEPVGSGAPSDLDDPGEGRLVSDGQVGQGLAIELDLRPS